MKKASYVFHLLCVLGIFVLSSCGFDEITGTIIRLMVRW